MLNSNIRCIEMGEKAEIIHDNCPLNSNIRCIEI